MTLRPLTLALAALTAMLTACVSIPLSLDTSKSGSDASMIAPMVEKRETLVATGYAVVSVQNHKVPAQQRLLAIRAAKLDAYRNLAEQVYGTRLDSSTTVAEMAVTNDRFRSRVDGVIYGAILSNITPINNDTYEVTLTLDGAVVNDIRLLYLEQFLKNGNSHP